MKKIFYLIVLFLVGCEKPLIDEIYLDETPSDFSTYTLTQNQISTPDGMGVLKTISNVQLNFHTTIGYNELFVMGSKGFESVVWKRENKEWKNYIIEDTRIHGGRNYRKINNSTFVISGTGETGYIPYDEWVDHIYVGTIFDGSLSYNQVSTTKRYYHGISVGDITNDGLYDIVANSGIFFIQNQDGTFEEYDYLNQDYQNPIIDVTKMRQLGNPIEPQIVDIFEGGRPEILIGFVDDNDRNKGEVFVYEYSNLTNKYELVSEIKNTSPYGKQVNSMEISDFNNDGYNDVAILRWGYTYDGSSMMLDVWLGSSNKTFTKSFEKYWPFQETNSAQFNLFDVNHDGYDDIVFRPFGGTVNPLCEWRYHTEDEMNNGIYVNKLVMINDGNGKFNYINKDIIIKDISDVEYLIPFMRDGNLVFIGNKSKEFDTHFETTISDIEINKFIW